jgi:fluoride ion exporter CrcB/FEX
MAEQGAFFRAGVYVLGSNVIGFAGVWLGATLARLTSI